MTSKDVQKAQKAEKAAEQDLEDADDLAQVPAWRKKARGLRRAAKKRRAKAERRAGKFLCRGEDVL